jgi:hypothetical protein
MAGREVRRFQIALRRMDFRLGLLDFDMIELAMRVRV